MLLSYSYNEHGAQLLCGLTSHTPLKGIEDLLAGMLQLKHNIYQLVRVRAWCHFGRVLRLGDSRLGRWLVRPRRRRRGYDCGAHLSRTLTLLPVCETLALSQKHELP